MARLTRTQKFAELREQLANDKETSVQTQDLSPLKDRLDNIQERMAPSTVVPQQEYAWNEFEDDTVAPVQSAAPVEEVKVEETVQEAVETVAKKLSPIDEIISAFQVEEDEISTSEVEESAPVEPEEYTSVEQLAGVSDFVYKPFNQESKDESTSIGEGFNLSVDELYSEVFNDVKDVEGEEVTKKERDTYLDQTLSDVNAHNANSGLKTIDEIIEDNVNDVRHPETNAQPNGWQSFKQPEVVSKPVEDSDISNTISQDIGKLMQDIEVKPEPIKKAPVEEVKVQPTVDPNKEVVEIKNIAELDKKNVRDTISETIPFVVTSDEDETDIEEYEEDGSNVVLNVILIVLIVILVAVLGLIVFYILKTKGII